MRPFELGFSNIIREKHLRRIREYLNGGKNVSQNDLWLSVGYFHIGNGADDNPFTKEEWGKLLKDTKRA